MPRAVEAYRNILTDDPAHAETRAALERMFLGAGLRQPDAVVMRFFQVM